MGSILSPMTAPGTIALPCPHCHAMLSFAPEQAGLSGPCAYCGQTVAVPSGGVAAPFSTPGFPAATPAMSGQETSESTGVRHGRVAGASFVVIGAILWAIAAAMLNSTGSTLRVLLVGPVLFFWGLSLLVFPGADVSFADFRANRVEKNAWFSGAPILHKIVWGVAGLIGIVFAVALLF